MATVLEHHHVASDPEILSGEPVIRGTRTPIRAIVELWRMGIAPEEIPTRLPHLTLSQVFDALGYFADNQQQILGFIERNQIPDDLVGTRKSFS